MTKISNVKKAVWFTVLALMVLATGCAGSGSSDSSSGGTAYSGKTGQATITQDNAQTLAANGSNSGKLSSTAGSAGSGAPRLFHSPAFYAQVAETALAPKTTAGNCGGTSVADSTYDSATSKITGVTTYTSYCQNGETINGQMSLSGTYVQATSVMDVTVTFTNYSVKSTASDNVMNGTATIKGTLKNGSINPVSLTMNVDSKDNAANVVMKMENVVATSSTATTYSEIAISSGRIYHPDNGYFDVSTPTAMHTNNGDANPSSGVFLITGANNTKAKLTYLSSTQYKIEVDLNGSGTYTLDGTYNWSDPIVVSSGTGTMGAGTGTGTGTGSGTCRTYATAVTIVATGASSGTIHQTYQFDATAFTLTIKDTSTASVVAVGTYRSVADFVDEAPGMSGGVGPAKVVTTTSATDKATTTNTYDASNRHTVYQYDVTVNGATSTMFKETFSAWDTKGRVTASKRDYVAPGASTEKCTGQNITYTYDDTNRTLTTVISGGTSQSAASPAIDWCALNGGTRKQTFDANLNTTLIDSTIAGIHTIDTYTTTATAQQCK